MSEELFTRCYVEEGISAVFTKILRENGFIVNTAEELKKCGKSDEEHLDIAIGLESTLITTDKRTFIDDSNALHKNHFGIIILTTQVATWLQHQLPGKLLKNTLMYTLKMNGRILL